MNTPALAPVLPSVMPGPAPANATPPRDGEPGAFARELQAAAQPDTAAGAAVQTDKAPPADDEAAAAAARSGDDAAQQAGSGLDAARAATGRPTLQRWPALVRAGDADRAPDADAGATAVDAAAGAERTERAARHTDDEATAPEAAAWLATMQPRAPEDPAAAARTAGAAVPAMPAAPADAAPATDTTEAGDITSHADAARAGTGGPRHAAASRAGDGLPAPKAEADGPGTATERGNAPGPARDEAVPGAAAGSGPTPSNAAMPLQGFAAELARAGHAHGAAGAAAPAAAELNLRTPVSAPEFVPRLTGELAVLARDGVQEARVQVNPLELGPIAVQITLDGSAAQVRLAVDSAQTRDLLEQAMPALAAALRENGLTLTGGGVFQQPRGQGRDDRGADNPSAGDGDGGRHGDTEPVVASVAPRRMRHPGQVDVFA